MNEIIALAQRTNQAVQFGPAPVEALNWLAAQGIPDSVRQFYALAEPGRIVESEGVYLIPVAKMMDVNQHVVPGAFSSPFGYIVIAETVSGDAYCVNIHCADVAGQPPIYLLNHERLGRDATVQDVRRNGRLVTNTFRQFLQRFAAGTLPYDYSHQA
ncbi:MAG: SMI1/KNR4 family protein [Anaerolineales bacterium]|nr:SMI1/KNR4 family protein [Anaerolineales bacterium]